MPALFELPHGGKKLLIQRWNGRMASLGVEPDRHFQVLDDLITRHNEPQRVYHNLAHLSALFDALPADHLEQPALDLAVWFHDAVYDPTRADNEEASADLSGQRMDQLGLNGDLKGRVRQLILATQKHLAPDETTALFLDADLSILGQKERTYKAYAKAIRQEYAWVPDALFYERRKAVLENFLKRPRIYQTERFSRLEAKARENMGEEIGRLTESAVS